MFIDTNLKIVLRIFFLTFSDTNMWFTKKKLEWRNYAAIKALFITKKVELINKKKFIVATLDKNAKTFVIYGKARKVTKIVIY